ncbi:hypothetical protein E3V36_01745 [Candidatus Marinimicrobia bacterium MT.SAG.2]|nr:hypothetical protein E3V36_01745 [Candidatus Marinimicrobia bacterium MT.SAG.2]
MTIPNHTVYKNIRKFRNDRLKNNVDKIAKDLFTVDATKLNGPMVVLHCVPIGSSPEPDKLIDIGDYHLHFSNLLRGYTDTKTHYGSSGITISADNSYCMFMNKGAKLEYASVLFSDTEKKPYFIDIRKLEGFVIQLMTDYISILKNIDIGPSMVVLLSIIHTSDSKLKISDKIINDNKEYLKGIEGHKIDVKKLLVPEILIDDYTNDINMEKIFHPIFNIIWNAGGYPGSLLYDENENRID